jgi:hypothetical protein
MHLARMNRRALRRIGAELRRDDPLLASMLTEDNDVSTGGQHPENGKMRRRQAKNDARRCSPYVPFVMF